MVVFNGVKNESEKQALEIILLNKKYEHIEDDTSDSECSEKINSLKESRIKMDDSQSHTAEESNPITIQKNRNLKNRQMIKSRLQQSRIFAKDKFEDLPEMRQECKPEV